MIKKIIIFSAAGLLSFSAMFALAWFTKKTPPAPIAQSDQTEAGGQKELSLAQLQIPTTGSGMANISKNRKAMSEKQLKSLVYEIREKIDEYNYKFNDLKTHEQRLKIAQDTLKKDIEELNNLQSQLAATVQLLKNEQENLLKSRVEIAKSEKDNLITIAATYDKMDTASAGKILTNMSQGQGDNVNDAIKILHYMSERTKAKVLAAIAETEPKISAYFCQKLKQIIEKD